ncbi:GTP-binding nuclear protein Ran-like [Drosophila busckii]|uniref:GTP-binding nuclear protein Ran-like n=1 Tax=Drosophila busckii TaxID=30019 RepID=UPI00083F2CE3|nr:GTP-binding nuclear protein Ran-like [Drosophila busckii]
MDLQSNTPTTPTFKCLLLGDSGVGKSTFLRRHATGEFREQHVPTIGLNVHALLLQTSYQAAKLELWDVAGDSRHGGIHNGYFFFAKCAIIMFDLSVPSTAISVSRWLQQLAQICGQDLPIVICGNKAELERMPQQLVLRQQSNLDYCEISACAAWNLDAPLELLCRRLLQRQDLRLIAQPKLLAFESCMCNLNKMKQQMEAVRRKMLVAKDADCNVAEDAENEANQRIILN